MSLESKISIQWKSSQKKKKDNILSRMDECPNSYAKKKKSDAKDNVL